MPNDPTESLDSRRAFLKKAALLAAGGSLAGGLAASIQRALAIEPAAGSSYREAEHVVILMQENRSFDHVFGTLQGVRGFNDPRAVWLPDGNPVWLQTDAAGNTFAPFHLDLLGSRSTWMGGLPHGRLDQGEARNQGKHDRWLVAKPIEDRAYAGFPLSLGYYSRADIPFYYGLADAFTVCDQAFCSVIGPTIPNRLHLWTGTVRPDKTQHSRARVQNEDTDFGAEASWTTFPERLEARGISWKNYQNELAVPSGLAGDGDAWLSNFGDNPLEFFTQYGVYFAAPHRRHLAAQAQAIEAELLALDSAPQPLPPEREQRRAAARKELESLRAQVALWTEENFSRLPVPEQNLHLKAFATNADRGDYRELATLRYHDGMAEREMVVPKGDVMHQFREDVRTGRLPTVSWIIPPERFSDHPSNPWYGALYVSETLDILTQNPEVWKKTIFILCYDENDGYFDHIPPFVPPRADRGDTGKASRGIDTSSEHVLEDRGKDLSDDGPGPNGRDGPIGLGFRVPLVVASPWSRGGYVCSEVFDHTSVLRFLENFLGGKSGRPLVETNISDWRRTVCGDLTSVFRVGTANPPVLPAPLDNTSFLSQINRAQFQPLPAAGRRLRAEETKPHGALGMAEGLPRQEPGSRPACALPYELSVDGALTDDRAAFRVTFGAGDSLFGSRAAGAPFHVYSPAKFLAARGDVFEVGRTWAYAVRAGDQIDDRWALADFEDHAYFLRVHGPNGFFREFRGENGDPQLSIALENSGRGPAAVILTNSEPHRAVSIILTDLSYGGGAHTITLDPAAGALCRAVFPLALAATHGWYDFGISVPSAPRFGKRYAGRVETGRESRTDPMMG